MVSGGFNWTFLSRSDSTEPEQAGVLGAVVGSAIVETVKAELGEDGKLKDGGVARILDFVRGLADGVHGARAQAAE